MQSEFALSMESVSSLLNAYMNKKLTTESFLNIDQFASLSGYDDMMQFSIDIFIKILQTDCPIELLSIFIEKLKITKDSILIKNILNNVCSERKLFDKVGNVNLLFMILLQIDLFESMAYLTDNLIQVAFEDNASDQAIASLVFIASKGEINKFTDLLMTSMINNQTKMHKFHDIILQILSAVEIGTVNSDLLTSIVNRNDFLNTIFFDVFSDLVITYINSTQFKIFLKIIKYIDIYLIDEKILPSINHGILKSTSKQDSIIKNSLLKLVSYNKNVKSPSKILNLSSINKLLLLIIDLSASKEWQLKNFAYDSI